VFLQRRCVRKGEEGELLFVRRKKHECSPNKTCSVKVSRKAARVTIWQRFCERPVPSARRDGTSSIGACNREHQNEGNGTHEG